MIFFIIALFGIAFCWDLSAFSQDLHHMCLSVLPFEKSSVPEIYSALVCGKRLPSGEVKQLFVKGGLIHLTVVSGAHLLFLERFILKLPLPKNLKKVLVCVFLIIYSLVSCLHPPILRALFAFFLSRISESFKLFWSPLLLILLSAFLCLIYQNSLADSFSLQLSVLAALLYHSSKNSLAKCLFIYLFTLPIINCWQDLHTITVLINWIFAPFIGVFLFPLSVLSSFLPFLYPLTDLLWLGILKLLKTLEIMSDQPSLFSWSLAKDWIWLYILGLGSSLYFFQTLHKRRKLKS